MKLVQRQELLMTSSFCIRTRWKALDEVYQMFIPLHLGNPDWKPRKASLRSVIRAKNIAPAMRQASCSDAAGPSRKK